MPNPGGSGLALSLNPTTSLALSHSSDWVLPASYQSSTQVFQVNHRFADVAWYSHCLFYTAMLRRKEHPVDYLGYGLALLLFVYFSSSNSVININSACCGSSYRCRQYKRFLGYVQYFVLEPGNLFGYNTEANRPYGIFQQPNDGQFFSDHFVPGLPISEAAR